MCGFIGLVNAGATGADTGAAAAIERGLATIAHRGPDDDGLFVHPSAPVVLGHRRLAIIDPGGGEQPMHSQDGDLSIVYNGAIYNYLELRRELIGLGHPIKSYSDTEVILYAYRQWGEACLQRFLGMFAFAIWDSGRKELFCARDRIGIKPFYYAVSDGKLVFASEIKAILATGAVPREANPEGLKDYLTFQFCLGEKTLFRHIRKLEPGYGLRAKVRDGRLQIQSFQYWDLHYEIDERHDEKWFSDQLAGLIEDSTRIHLRSDVSLGAHLSGGLDSSVVVCLAANLLRGEQIKTFTGAFPEGPQFDETGYAKAVAAFAETSYNEIYIDGGELPDVLPRLMYVMDEPVAGPGVIPQYYVSQLAAQHVKVVLGGQGGDELFVGYARYLVAYLEKCLSGAIFETAHDQQYAVTLESIVPNLPLLKTYKPMLSALWSEGLFDESDRRYFKLIDRSAGMNHLFSPEVIGGAYDPFEPFAEIFNRADLHSLINQMTYFDLKGSLPALLHVEDRTSMAASIESRVPLLDHRIVEFMATIPPNVKFAGGRMKHIFKGAVQSIVPTEIFERRDKMGFPTPLTQWTRGVAREFVEDTLLSQRVRERGIYNTDAVEAALTSEGEYGRVVWGLLCLELWHRLFIDGDAASFA